MIASNGKRRVALVIGNENYDEARGLKNPINDAKAVSQVLRTLGFDLITVDRHSAHNTNLGLIQMARALADFSVEAEAAQTAVFYFAGHGLEVDGRNYLLPKDARLKNVRRMYFETIKLDDVRLAVEHASHLRLIILDCCRDDPFNVPMRGLDEKRSVSRGLAAPAEPRGNTGIAYAAKHGTTASDGPNDDNSPFAQALIELLPTCDLDVRLLFGRIRDKVISLTNGEQEPHFYSNFGGQELFLNVASQAQRLTVDRPLLNAGLHNGGLPSPIEEAQRLWAEFRIDDTDDPELVEAYIQTVEHIPLMVHKARKRLEMLAIERHMRDGDDWRIAERDDAVASYQAYLKSWPSGAHAEKARHRIEQLEEAAAWKDAERSSNSTALQNFISRYPMSAHVREAKQRISGLEEQAAWEAARTAELIELVRDFIDRYPEGNRAEEAKQLLQQLEQRDFVDKGFVKVDTWTPQGQRQQWIAPGGGRDDRHMFRDFEHGPEMVIVPKGEFLMGSPPDEIAALVKEYGNDWAKSEGPQHRVTIPEAFAIGQYTVTFAEWDAFATATGGYKPEDHGWGRGDRPVINVSWDDIQAYLAWLCQMSGLDYRLPSEAEWEYAARAATVTPFWWGSSISTDKANYNGNYTYAGSLKGEYRRKTVPVKSFDPNPWGLYQVHGNIWEWCADQWHDSYADKPDGLKANGGSWSAHGNGARVVRGGSWDYFPYRLRSAFRNFNYPGGRFGIIGFRVARTLLPL